LLAVALLGSVCAVGALRAQQPVTGRIVGRVIDAQTGRGVSDAGVQVVGTTRGVMSQLDGRFAIGGIPAGTVSLHVRLIGYQPKTVTGILLGPGQVLEQDVSLQPTAVQLEATVVTVSAERGSVAEALDAQRTAAGIVSAVTAEQIAKSPDSDAAAAVQRVSGVTVQDGRYVFVRGLGERYTTTSLNGSRVPSPEPERKVVPLDLFPASLLQTVSTSKTFTPDQPGDFSGAQVDIRTREFPARRQVAFSTSLGYNDRATGSVVPRNPAEHLDWLGFGGAERRLPVIVGTAGAFDDPPPSQRQVNQMVGAFRDVWTPRLQSGSPNSSLGITIGGSDPVLGHPVGYVGSLTYSYNQEVRAAERRAFAVPEGDTEAEVDRFEGSTGRASVLWGGLLNLSTLVGSSSRISLNNTYTRSADSEAKREVGIEEDDQATNIIQRLRYVERSVWASQVAGEHELGARHRLEWSLSGSGVRRYEPDRSEIVYRDLHDGLGAFWLNDPEAAVRTFSDLTESSYGAAGSYALRFGAPGREHVVEVGGSYRYTTRDSETSPYSITADLPLDERRRSPEEIFDGRFSQADDDFFRVTALLQGGAYDAMDVLSAGYGMLEYQLSERLRFIGGARVEYSWVDVDAIPTFGTPVEANPTYTDILPSAALTVQLNETQQLRVSLSQTLARPEYREIAPIAYRTVLAGEIERGNAELRRTLIQNADVRWEWYPNPGEVLSVALFAKRFEDPIERIYRGTSGTRVTTFINADEASNYGLELELRKGLAFAGMDRLTAFGNLTVMRSDIRLRDGEESFDTERPMVGQAPFVVNAGLTYASESGTSSATLLYNVVGRRIYSAALLPLPNIYEEARHVVDVSLRFPLLGGLAAKVDAKNLLDDPYEVTQGAVTREFYRGGRVFQVGLAWRR
jgi:hypothetical protein